MIKKKRLSLKGHIPDLILKRVFFYQNFVQSLVFEL